MQTVAERKFITFKCYEMYSYSADADQTLDIIEDYIPDNTSKISLYAFWKLRVYQGSATSRGFAVKEQSLKIFSPNSGGRASLTIRPYSHKTVESFKQKI